MEFETNILRKFKKHLYQGAPILSNGNSEIFTHDVLGLDQRVGSPMITKKAA
jgi:hypothetical protein